MRKPMIWIAGSVGAGIIGLAAWVALGLSGGPDAYRSDAMVNIDGADIGGPFALIDQTGKAVTDKTVLTAPSLVYFGYTFCPDICPIDVQIIVDAVDILADQGVAVTPVFITVDPERDTAAELAFYAEAMHPTMIALTGSQEAIRAAADAYKVYYQRVETPDSAAEYLMQHTGYTYLVTPDEGVIALFRRDFPPEKIAEDIAAILSRR